MHGEGQGKSEGSEGTPTEKIVVRLKLRIVALERELARYGSKYGFTETARELLSATEED